MIKPELIRIRQYLEYTLHELPAGVLYDSNGADEIKCKELMSEVFKFEKMCDENNYDCRSLIEVCKWHYERYPHYLSRHRHFGNYENYMIKYKALKYK